MRMRIIFCLGCIFFISIFNIDIRSTIVSKTKVGSANTIIIAPSATKSSLPSKKVTPTPSSSTSSQNTGIFSLFDNALADAIGTILASIITGLWISKKYWIPYILSKRPIGSPLRNKKKRRNLALYLQSVKEKVLNDSVAGALDLHVRDIVGSGTLFIPPPWKNLHGQVQTEDLVKYFINELSKGNRILLLGEPGQGKTITLKQVFTLMIDQFIASKENLPPVPLYIPLRDFTDSSDEKLDLEWIHKHYRFPLSFEDFDYLVRNKNVIFLFDGFDEIIGELTQRSINQRASSDLFSHPSVLTCRKLFYNLYLGMSRITERYTQKFELQPLVLNDSIRRYIDTFSKVKQEIDAQVTSTPPELIFKTIRESKALQDLVQRPLLLVMVLDVFTNPQEMVDREWNMERIYSDYTHRWLENEVSRAGSVLTLEEKTTLIQGIAWSTFRKEAPNPYRPYQSAVFTREEVFSVLKRFPDFYQDQDLKLKEVADDICLRTFLITNERGRYYFIHKSFQEYYVARYVYEAIHDKGLDLDYGTQALQEVIPEEVSAFLKEMLKSKELIEYEKNQMTNTLLNVYLQNSADDNLRAVIRQNASYYLAVLGTASAIQFLEGNYQREPNKLVQRGMMVGLALHCGRIDMLDNYVNIIREDEKAKSINVGYHLVHYGDQGIEEGYEDAKGERCLGTIQGILRHLRSEDYRNTWALDLFTLRVLLETRRTAILHQVDEQDMLFIKQFLSRDYKQQGKIFQQEKKQLQQVLKQITKKLSKPKSDALH